MDLTRTLAAKASFLEALSNANRLMALSALLPGEMSVTELASAVGLSQSAMSQHLSKLRQAKIVAGRRDAQVVYYSISSTAARKVLASLDAYFGGERLPGLERAQ